MLIKSCALHVSRQKIKLMSANDDVIPHMKRKSSQRRPQTTTITMFYVRIQYLLAHIISHYVANHLCNASRMLTMKYKENKKALRIQVIYILPSDCVCNHGAANFACKKWYIIIITEIFLLHNQAGNSRRLIGALTKAEQKKPPKAK